MAVGVLLDAKKVAHLRVSPVIRLMIGKTDAPLPRAVAGNIPASPRAVYPGTLLLVSAAAPYHLPTMAAAVVPISRQTASHRPRRAGAIVSNLGARALVEPRWQKERDYESDQVVVGRVQEIKPPLPYLGT